MIKQPEKSYRDSHLVRLIENNIDFGVTVKEVLTVKEPYYRVFIDNDTERYKLVTARGTIKKFRSLKQFNIYCRKLGIPRYVCLVSLEDKPKAIKLN